MMTSQRPGSLRAAASGPLAGDFKARSTMPTRQMYGLEVPAQLVWRRWEPGAEYTKTITVKNVSGKVVTVVHRLNRSKAFCLDFPQPMRLSPGMSTALRVVFRPLRAQPYTDVVQVLCDGAVIEVELSAPLASPQLQAPPRIDFGLVPARERAARALPIANTGGAPLEFAWRVGAPFAVSPAVGRLAPGERAACEVSFEPVEAAAFEGSAACELDTGEVVVVQLAGAAKLPHLMLEASRLDLGAVPVDRSATAQLRIANPSPVPAQFRVEAEDAVAAAGLLADPRTSGGGAEEGVFAVSPQGATLGPGEYGLLTVTFAPKTAGATAFQRFVLATPGGAARATLQVRGAGEGPRLVLAPRVLDFGSVRAGQAVSKAVYIDNASDVPAAYEFLDEGGGVFLLSRPRGVVPPRSVAHTRVSFVPTAPANYWRRLACVVKDAAPIALDVLGTCWDDRSRPPPLTYAHVCTYLARTEAGGAPVPRASDDEGWALESDTAAVAAVAAAEAAATAFAAAPPPPPAGDDSPPASPGGTLRPPPGWRPPVAGEGVPPRLVGPDGWGLLFEGQDPAGGLQLSTEAIDFGACSRLSSVEPRTVTVANRTGAKLTVFACIPPWEDPLSAQAADHGTGAAARRSPSPANWGAPASGASGGSPSSLGLRQAAAAAPFQVFPDSLELRPGASGALRIAFRPPRDGQSYRAAAQIVAYVKAQRNFRLVQEGHVVPPWTRTLAVLGHTFAPPLNPEFSPKVRLSSPAVAFPPLRPGQAGYQTLAVVNYGDTPVAFAFDCAALPAELQLLPATGIAPPKAHTLIALRYTPPAAAGASTLSVSIPVVFNHTPVNSARLLVTGSAHTALITTNLAPRNRLYLRPTCVGSSSTQTVEIVNPGRVEAGWAWVASRRLRGVVTFTPQAGVLQGGESCEVAVTFRPMAVQTYEARTAVIAVEPSETANTGNGSAGYGGRSSPDLQTAGSSGQDGQQDGIRAESGSTLPDGAPSSEAAAGKVVILVSGEGTPSTLRLEPSEGVRFGAVRVGYAERRLVTLVNESDGTLRYRAVLVEGLEPEDGSNAPPEAAAGGSTDRRKLAAAMVAAASKADAAAAPILFDSVAVEVAGVDQDSTGEGNGGGEAEAWVDKPEGSVGGRARVTLEVTLLPRRRRTYNLRLAIVDAGVAGAAVDLATNGGINGDAAAAVGVPLASVAVTAEAAFPVVLITDLACDSLPKQVAWQQLGVPALNLALASPVTLAELALLAQDARGGLTTDAAAARLPPLPVDLGTLPAGAALREVAVWLFNPGALEAAWELHSYDDPELEPELWVGRTKPLTAVEAHRAAIVELGILSAHPRSGRLAPGRGCQVTLTAAPVREGGWMLPLFLRVKDGRQLHLVLKVLVLPPGASSPGPLPPGPDFHLAPTPIGEMQPVLQSHVLRNGGPGPLEYVIDAAPLSEVARGSYGFEVLKYVGGAPLNGTIPPGDVAIVNWAFQPLEARPYRADLPLSLGGEPAGTMALVGRGYHPLQERPEEGETAGEAARNWRHWLGFDLAPVLHPAWRPLRISPELLSMGPCPPSGESRRLLRLDNSAAVPLAFAWDLGAFVEARGCVSGRLMVRPDGGVLAPGEAVVCQVVFSAGSAPQLFEADVRCTVWPAEESSRSYEVHGSGSGALERSEHEGQKEEEEEIIAQHPPRPTRPVPPHSTLDARVSAARLPLHESMTTAALGKSQVLQQRFLRTLAARQQQGGEASGQQQWWPSGATTASALGGGQVHGEQGAIAAAAATLPAGFVQQVTVVTVYGAVITEAQSKAGAYLAPEERPEAAALGAESALAAARAAAAGAAPPVQLAQPRWQRPQGADNGGGGGEDGESSGGDPLVEKGLAAAEAVLHDWMTEALAGDEVAAALADPGPAPDYVYRGDGVMEEVLVAGGSSEDLAAPGGEAAAGAAEGASGSAAAGAVAFADYVLDSALVGALQDVVDEGGIGSGGGRPAR